MRPPPTDPIFTILVSLLTVLISIPVTMILTVVLEEYCSKFPGGRLHGEAFMVEKDESTSTSVSKGAQMLTNATNEYGFGDVIRKGIWKGTQSNVNGTSDTSKIAYNGMFTCYPDNQNFLIKFEYSRRLNCLIFPPNSNHRFLVSCGRGNDDSGSGPFISFRW